MGVFEQFPYSNYHDLNLDWVLSEIKRIGGEMTALRGEMGTFADTLRGDFVDFTREVRGEIDAFEEILGEMRTEVDNIPETIDAVLTEKHVFPMPVVSDSDNGKVWSVINGEWGVGPVPNGNLPPVTTADNGKLLVADNGGWIAGIHSGEITGKIGKSKLYKDGSTTFDILDRSDADFQTGYGFQGSTGNVIAIANCNLSGYIYLDANENAIIDYYVTNTSYRLKIGKYDTNKTWISTNEIVPDSTGPKQATYTATDAGYVRIQFWNNNNPITVKSDGYLRISSKAVNLDGLFLSRNLFDKYLTNEVIDLIDKSDPSFLPGKVYSGTTGNITNFATGNISNYISLSAGETLNVSYTLTSTMYNLKYAIYNTSNVWQRTVALAETETGTKVFRYTASENCKIRIQYYTFNEPVSAYVLEFRYFKSNTLPIKGYAYNADQFSLKKWTSFGDSITYQNKWQPEIASILSLIHSNCGIGSTALSGSYVLGDTSLPSFWMSARLDAVKATDPDVITILGGANDVFQAGLTIGSDNEFEYPAPANAEASCGAAAYDPSASYSVGSYCTYNNVRYECTTAISGGEAWNAAHWKAVKNVDSFIGAYSYIIENLLAWKRTLSIVILGTTWAENDGIGHAHGIDYTMLSDASRKVAQYYGLPFTDLHGKAGFNKFTMGTGANAIYSNDTIHPNEAGAKRITKLVLNTMLNELTV